MKPSILALVAVGALIMLMYSRDTWSAPASARPYLSTIYDAERAQSLPPNLLARVLYQESRYRQDIITGQEKSRAGAVGIAQIVPRWHPTVDPLNVDEAIHYAAAYLRRLYNRFGRWDQALAAYNWGQGNLAKAIEQHGSDWLAHAPQ